MHKALSGCLLVMTMMLDELMVFNLWCAMLHLNLCTAAGSAHEWVQICLWMSVPCVGECGACHYACVYLSCMQCSCEMCVKIQLVLYSDWKAMLVQVAAVMAGHWASGHLANAELDTWDWQKRRPANSLPSVS